jgi:predicted metal-dependent hydrolase
MDQPNLTWNKTLTHRKFGHYQANTDTVMLSISLDKSSTPAYVIEFVMYHELLHKQLGVVTNRGRRYAHTKAFREAEARFPQQEQAQAYLNKLSLKIGQGK